MDYFRRVRSSAQPKPPPQPPAREESPISDIDNDLDDATNIEKSIKAVLDAVERVNGGVADTASVADGGSEAVKVEQLAAEGNAEDVGTKDAEQHEEEQEEEREVDELLNGDSPGVRRRVREGNSSPEVELSKMMVGGEGAVGDRAGIDADDAAAGVTADVADSNNVVRSATTASTATADITVHTNVVQNNAGNANNSNNVLATVPATLPPATPHAAPASALVIHTTTTINANNVPASPLISTTPTPTPTPTLTHRPVTNTPQHGFGLTRVQSQEHHATPGPSSHPATPPPPPPPATSPNRDATLITIAIRDANNFATFMRVKPTTKLSKLFRAYADRYSVDLGSLRFISCHGVQLPKFDRTATIAGVGLEDLDEIDVMLEQIGGTR